jgi:chromate transporter
MAASALVLTETSDKTWPALLITLGAALVASTTRLNPLWLLLVGGCLGFTGILG